MVYNVKSVGGSLDCTGNRQISESTFPLLEYVGGDFILAGSAFTRMPDSLTFVGGRAIISRSDPASLLLSLKQAEAKGIIKGGVFLCD